MKHDITISLSCQWFETAGQEYEPRKNTRHIYMRPTRGRDDFPCPVCGCRHVHVNGTFDHVLKDMPLSPGERLLIHVPLRRFECQRCGHVYREDEDLGHAGTRVTKRLAEWILALLKAGPVSAVAGWTCTSWGTVKRIHSEAVEGVLSARRRKQVIEGYRPRYLAVDEFAIHRGHRYASSVMDVETGEVIWVGKGRSVKDFRLFFEEVEPELLEGVEAVAMDMNASYNIVMEEMLPDVEIVYDRYHMEAQYGREVMGSVRLEEARERLEASRMAENRTEAQRLKREYSELKGARWLLLSHPGQDDGKLARILEGHASLAVCFAMKERMSELFKICDTDAARQGWTEWFDAAGESGIPQLQRFAKLKKSRIEGLVSHARHMIGTGRLEGMNNKIKVLKRIAYGFRDESYFFSLIRFMTIPNSHKV